MNAMSSLKYLHKTYLSHLKFKNYEKYIVKNIIKNVINEIESELGYKEAMKFERDKITSDKIDFDNLKDKAFYMACALVHIHYELGKIEDAIDIIGKAEDYIEVVKK